MPPTATHDRPIIPQYADGRNGHQPPATQAVDPGPTVALPAVLEAITHVLAAADELARVEPQLRARIEANRRRSERHNHNTRGGRPSKDERLVLTRTGLAVECRRCGRVLAVDAMPGASTANGPASTGNGNRRSS